MLVGTRIMLIVFGLGCMAISMKSGISKEILMVSMLAGSTLVAGVKGK